MSRSYKKIKIFPRTCKDSEKFDKTKANRKLRTSIKVRIAKKLEVLPLMKEVSNVWAFAKDGKHYWANATKKDMSK